LQTPEPPLAAVRHDSTQPSSQFELNNPEQPRWAGGGSFVHRHPALLHSAPMSARFAVDGPVHWIVISKPVMQMATELQRDFIVQVFIGFLLQSFVVSLIAYGVVDSIPQPHFGPGESTGAAPQHFCEGMLYTFACPALSVQQP
jgi:hypothetical protein